jgi:hypothetical protein
MKDAKKSIIIRLANLNITKQWDVYDNKFHCFHDFLVQTVSTGNKRNAGGEQKENYANCGST